MGGSAVKAILGFRSHFSFVVHKLAFTPTIRGVTHEGKPVVVLEIPRAYGKPVRFQGLEFIRVGSYRQKLKDHPQIEKELWRVFDTTPFEELVVPCRTCGRTSS